MSKKDRKEQEIRDKEKLNQEEQQHEVQSQADNLEQEQDSASYERDDDSEKVENGRKEEQGNEGWENKFNQLNDKHLRLFSEFDNYRKRTMREKADLIKSASAELIKEMLPLMDDMDRAIAAVPEDQKEARKGMELIRDKFMTILRQKGLKEMDSRGEEFNTDYHEAITQVPAPKEELKGKVVDVVEKGYFLNDKVLRFAKVVVGK
ncbi:MAG: nucleotide exchange factor GrpE [Bacteroidales bacterium]